MYDFKYNLRLDQRHLTSTQHILGSESLSTSTSSQKGRCERCLDGMDGRRHKKFSDLRLRPRLMVRVGSTLNQIPFAVVLKAASNATRRISTLFRSGAVGPSYFCGKYALPLILECIIILDTRRISTLSCSTAVGPHLTFLWQIRVTSHYFRVRNYLTYLCFTH
jgi:hypothetical protein